MPNIELPMSDLPAFLWKSMTAAIVVRSGFAKFCCVLLSCDQESKRAPAGATKSRSTSAKASAGRQSPRGLVPWIPRLRLRDRLSTIQQSEDIEVRAVHPSTHFVGGQGVSFGERRYLPFARA
jgi:hypothetical protein